VHLLVNKTESVKRHVTHIVMKTSIKLTFAVKRSLRGAKKIPFRSAWQGTRLTRFLSVISNFLRTKISNTLTRNNHVPPGELPRQFIFRRRCIQTLISSVKARVR